MTRTDREGVEEAGDKDKVTHAEAGPGGPQRPWGTTLHLFSV